MRYPKIGEQVRVKNETGLHEVKKVWKDRKAGIIFPRILLDDGRIFWNLDALVTRHQKWITVYVIQVHYGGRYGWEDVTQEELLSEARDRRKEYRDNVQYPVRLIRRKERNELYQGE